MLTVEWQPGELSDMSVQMLAAEKNADGCPTETTTGKQCWHLEQRVQAEDC